MKKNYYRLFDKNYYCVATYCGTKSNANAYFKRKIESLIPAIYAHDPFYVATYRGYNNFLYAMNASNYSQLK